MKIVKKLAALSFVIISSIAYGMDVEMEVFHPQYTATVQTYFSPMDRKAMSDDLFVRLDNARKSIYVAMYWITDDRIIDKLIAAKRRNIDVQVCIDESSPNPQRDIYIKKLRDNNVSLTVFPSKRGGNGKMHNKYFIIDSETVITGSANFTGVAMKTSSDKFNYENMLILYSPEIAAAYLSDFAAIQKG